MNPDLGRIERYQVAGQTHAGRGDTTRRAGLHDVPRFVESFPQRAGLMGRIRMGPQGVHNVLAMELVAGSQREHTNQRFRLTPLPFGIRNRLPVALQAEAAKKPEPDGPMPRIPRYGHANIASSGIALPIAPRPRLCMQHVSSLQTRYHGVAPDVFDRRLTYPMLRRRRTPPSRLPL